MKKFLFKVTLISGFMFTCAGYGYNVNQALMDACAGLAQAGEYPEEDIADVDLAMEEESKNLK